MSNLWIIKDSLGQINGPYETKELLIRIKNGAILGDEQIAAYPDGVWVDISTEPEFFDYMIDVLAGQDPKEIKQKEGKDTLAATVNLNEEENSTKSKIDIPDASLEGVQEIKSPSKEEDKGHDEDPVIEDKKKINRTLREAKGRSHLFEDRQADSIDKLEKLKRKEKERKSSQKILMLLFALGFGLFLSLFFLETKNLENENYIKYTLPERTKLAVSSAEEKDRVLNKVLALVKTDLVEKILESQKLLHSVLNFEPRNALSLQLLCSSYFRLWDLTGKTAADLNVVSEITKRAYGVGSSGDVLTVCRLVEMILRGKIDAAGEAVDTYLNAEITTRDISFSLRYFKGYILYLEKNYEIAKSFLESSVKIEPNWIPSRMLLGDVYREINRSQDAYNMYLKIISISHNHPDALYKIASVNIDIFSNTEKGLKYFDRANMVSKTYTPLKSSKSLAYAAVAKMYFKSGSYTRAENFAREAFDIDPSNLTAKNILISVGAKTDIKKADKYILSEAESLFNAKEWKAAAASYEQVYKLNPRNTKAPLRIAEAYWNLSFIRDAIKWAELAVAADPTNIEPYAVLAKFLINQYQLADATRVLMKARSIDGQNFKIYRYFAEIEFIKKNYENAILYAQAALKIYSNDVDSILILVKANIELGQLEKAFIQAKTAMEVSRLSFELENLYAILTMKVQGMSFAHDYIKSRLDNMSGDLKYEIIRSNIYYEDQQFEKAYQIAKEVNELLNWESYEALLAFARAAEKLKKLDTARDSYQKAYLINPSIVDPIFSSGVMLVENKEPGLAMKEFERVRGANPRYPGLDYQLARAHKILGEQTRNIQDITKSIEFAKNELEKNQVFFEAYILIAEDYYILGNITQSKVESMSSSDGDYSKTYSEMISWYKLCAKNYQKAIDIAPQPATIYIDMARCYRLSGALDQAQASAQYAENIDKGNALVWFEVAQIYEQQGNLPAALKAYETFMEVYPNSPNKKEVEEKINKLKGITQEGSASGTDPE